METPPVVDRVSSELEGPIPSTPKKYMVGMKVIGKRSDCESGFTSSILVSHPKRSIKNGS